MRITSLNRYKVASAMVRGFFNGYFFGQTDARMPGRKTIEPREYKQILADNYNTLSAHFVSVIFPVLIRLNFSDGEAVAADMQKRKFSNSTSPKILLRYACGTKALYDAVVADYQRQMGSLLNGKLQPIADFFTEYDRGSEDAEEVSVDLAIRSVVRVQMLAYATGIKAANTEVQSLYQGTVYKLMIHGMMALMHEEPVSLEGDNLEMIFRRVSLNSENFETLMNEMNQAYEDLA
ncbi:hypothetical protein [Prevotella sp. HUN102]|uniref:hypothetical protein n=1 Tax=Prevotella sp. HUN102 TaxID=1392486 RepID=UPI00048A88F1|nr:hypothetical protein [Prevotella sp. HUN102]